MNNDHTDYASFVRGLFKDGQAIRTDIAGGVSDEAISRLHAIIGIVGEVGELRKASWHGSKEEIQEELGDLLFYVEALRQHIEIRHIAVNFDSSRAHEILLSSSLDLLDLAKKEVIYAKELSTEQKIRYEQHYQLVAFAVTKIARNHDLPLEDVILANVTKLKKRYPGATYSNQAAAARLDKIGVDDDAS